MPDSAESGVPTIDSGRLADRLRDSETLTVLDIRDRDEFDQWHISGPAVDAAHIPQQRFIAARVTGTTTDLVDGLTQPLVVACAVGEASAEVAAQLRDAGVDAVNLAGGMAAWARQYDRVELPCPSARVFQYQRPSSGCLAYLIVAGDGDEREAAVIDPLRAFTDRYVADSEALGATLRWAIDTHVHADHVSGVRALAAETGVEIALPVGVVDRGVTFGGRVHFVSAGDCLPIGDVSLEALALPGHTSELLGYRLRDDTADLLCCGDTLFLDSVARPDLAVDADEVPAMARTLYESLQTLLAEPPETRIAPGHYGETTTPVGGAFVVTLAQAGERVALLSLPADAFVERITDSIPARPANDETIIAVNLGQEAVDDETAFTLELGPNHCSVGESA